jgi:hypothetical protein
LGFGSFLAVGDAILVVCNYQIPNDVNHQIPNDVKTICTRDAEIEGSTMEISLPFSN